MLTQKRQYYFSKDGKKHLVPKACILCTECGKFNHKANKFCRNKDCKNPIRNWNQD